MTEPTKEQIESALADVLAYIENGSPLPESKGDPYWEASASIERLGKVIALLPALSTALDSAEEERNELKAKILAFFTGAQYSRAAIENLKTLNDYKELGEYTAKILQSNQDSIADWKARAEEAEAQCKELEARLRSAADRAASM